MAVPDLDIVPEAPAVVAFPHDYPPSSIVIDTSGRRLYYVLGNKQAYMYSISVGREGFNWTGTETISRTQAWPDWHPPQEMRQRDPRLPEKMTGGTRNPLGAMALYLGTTLYRIHGTNDVKSIGQAQSSGCFRMMNASVVHLASVAEVGTMVTVVASLPKGVEVSQVPEPRPVGPLRASPVDPSMPPRRPMTIVICATTRCAGGEFQEGSMTVRSFMLSLACLAALAGRRWRATSGSKKAGPIIATSDSGSACGTRATCSSRRRYPRPVTAKCLSPETAEPGSLSAPLRNDAGKARQPTRTPSRGSLRGYRIDYRRLAGSWFVLSGEGNGKTFDEKVMFSCAGRLINSFAMVYPTDQRERSTPSSRG